MLSITKSLPAKLSWVRTSDILQKFFLLIRMLCFCFLHLNVTITMSFFFKWWHAWRSSGFTSWPVRVSALQMLFSRTSSPIDAGTGFIYSDLWRRYWILLTMFLSNWTILSLNKRLQFLLTVSSEERISYCLKKLLKQLVRSYSLEDMSSAQVSSTVNSSFGRFLVGFLFEPLWYMDIDDTI